MQYNEIPTRLSELYQVVGQWCFEHTAETDALIVTAVLLACVAVIRRGRRKRRKLIRLLRGMYMKRRDRVKFHMMGFEDAIVDYCTEAVHRGDMSEREEATYYKWFAEKFGMVGFKPINDTKNGIRARLKHYYNTRPFLPGSSQSAEADPPTNGGLETSRYANGG